MTRELQEATADAQSAATNATGDVTDKLDVMRRLVETIERQADPKS